MTPLDRRRLAAFRANRRGYRSLWIFGALFILTLCAELIANDRPILIWHDGGLYAPVLRDYDETVFGGEFALPANYRDPFIRDLIAQKGWALWPPIPYSHDSIDFSLREGLPAPVSTEHWLGTDDIGRDLLARLIYGFRISVLFGLALTGLSSVIGIAAGAVQGYFGGVTDLVFQRVIEIWSGLPQFFILLTLASLFVPGFGTLLLILLVFSWMALTGLVRAEFLRARTFEYVRAARALGVRDRTIMFRHVLPNAMVATLTFLPFIMSGSIVALTSLDFLGLGLPPGSPSLGELLAQGKANLHTPRLGLIASFAIGAMVVLLVFIGEAVRDAFDPRKTF